MVGLIDDPHERRLSLDFGGPVVFSDYLREGDVLTLTHVEADPSLRNTGAAGRFMEEVVAWARERGVKLLPACGYAVHWFARHTEAADVLSPTS